MLYFHVYCRGIEQKDIYIDELDYDRFLQSLWIFNNQKRVEFKDKIDPERQLLVDLMAFCLMPNHFHLLIKTDNPEYLAKYMQKLMTGYTMYFKKRYGKDGRLFESRYHHKHIKYTRYLNHLIDYIHNNPLKLKYPYYKSEDLLIGSFILDKEGENWLKEYKYSSRNMREVQPPLTDNTHL